MNPYIDCHIDTGSKDDPHAQARQARQQPVLLHSMSVFRELFEIIFATHQISTVVEIGVESGKVSRMYAELGASVVHCVEPHPSDEMRANLASHAATKLVQGLSPAVLPELPIADLYVIDGDHNYATVHAELSWLMAKAPDAVIVLHDVLWPCGRRDFYYQPPALDPGDRHPDTDDGPTTWHDELTPAGFVGLGIFTCATEAGGDRNGVLTAVEDALAAAPDDWRFEVIPAVFGMGILARTSPATDDMVERLQPWTRSRLLALMENNRIALYTRVLQMQAEAVAHADDADRLAESIARHRHDHEQLATRHADEIQRLHGEIERLRGLLSQRLRPRLSGALTRVGKAASRTARIGSSVAESR